MFTECSLGNDVFIVKERKEQRHQTFLNQVTNTWLFMRKSFR